MIELDNGYAIDVYDRGYIVGKTRVTMDAKTGTDRIVIGTPNYFTELSDAVEWAYKSMTRDAIGKHRKNITLLDAIKDMRSVEHKLHDDLVCIRAIEERIRAKGGEW